MITFKIYLKYMHKIRESTEKFSTQPRSHSKKSDVCLYLIFKIHFEI